MQENQRAAENVLIVGNPTIPPIPSQNGEEPQKLTNLDSAEREAIAIAPLFNSDHIPISISLGTDRNLHLENAYPETLSP